MVQPKELDGTANPRAFFGAEVRRVRSAAGLTQDGLGARMFLFGAYIGQIEATTRAPNKDLAERFDAALEAGGHFERLYQMVKRQREHPGFFATYAELEPTATKIEEYAARLVPGLLQTPAYARAVVRAGRPYTPEEKIEEMVPGRRSSPASNAKGSRRCNSRRWKVSGTVEKLVKPTTGMIMSPRQQADEDS
jgi:transcriptional regulator with XRE-family HTH domain